LHHMTKFKPDLKVETYHHISHGQNLNTALKNKLIIVMLIAMEAEDEIRI
jgi:hypothetical protein